MGLLRSLFVKTDSSSEQKHVRGEPIVPTHPIYPERRILGRVGVRWGPDKKRLNQKIKANSSKNPLTEALEDRYDLDLEHALAMECDGEK